MPTNQKIQSLMEYFEANKSKEASEFENDFKKDLSKGKFGVNKACSRELLKELIQIDLHNLKSMHLANDIFRDNFECKPSNFYNTNLSSYINAYKELSGYSIFQNDNSESGNQLKKFETYEAAWEVYKNLPTSNEYLDYLHQKNQLHETFISALRNGRFHMRDLAPQFIFQIAISLFTFCFAFVTLFLTSTVKAYSDYQQGALIPPSSVNKEVKTKLNGILKYTSNSSAQVQYDPINDNLKELFAVFDNMSYFDPKEYAVNDSILRFKNEEIESMFKRHITENKNKQDNQDYSDYVVSLTGKKVQEGDESDIIHYLRAQEYVGLSAFQNLIFTSFDKSASIFKDGINGFLNLGQNSQHENQEGVDYHLARQNRTFQRR